MLISLLFESPLIFIIVAVSLIASISIHEFAHAYIADKLGDPTAKYLGRVTLDPRSHLDPIGTLLLLFVGFGWGKPVPFNPINLQNPKRDGALIALAGPVSNFILALLLSLVWHSVSNYPIISTFLYFVIYFNLILGIFNLIPIDPLDGFKIVNGILPNRLSLQWQQTAQYGLIMLLIIVLTGTTERIIFPILDLFLMVMGIKPY